MIERLRLPLTHPGHQVDVIEAIFWRENKYLFIPLFTDAGDYNEYGDFVMLNL